MKYRKNIFKIAVDSPAAAGAGTLCKTISKYYNLLYLDTGKIYRMIAYLKISNQSKYNKNFISSRNLLLTGLGIISFTLLSIMMAHNNLAKL